MTALRTYQVCVYGSTWAAACAAMASVQRGASTILVSPSTRIGNPIADGLGSIDGGKYGSHGIGDWLLGEFFARFNRFIGVGPELITRAPPFVSEMVLSDMLRFYGVDVWTGSPVDSVTSAGGGNPATLLTLVSGITIAASAYIDCDVDADFAWKTPGVTTTYGRESAASTGEALAGYRPYPAGFKAVPGGTSGPGPNGLLYGLSPDPGLTVGAADLAVQVFTFRVPITADPRLKLSWAKPANYNTDDFELQWRLTDITNPDLQPFSTGSNVYYREMDLNGDWGYPYQWEWPTATYARRDEIRDLIWRAQGGYYWRLANDPAVHYKIRTRMAAVGMARREFPSGSVTTNGWPKQVYRRATRRLVNGAYRMTQADLQTTITKTDGTSMGFYTPDCHNMQNIATTVNGVEGFIKDSFRLDASLNWAVLPYQIPFSCMYTSECTNLLVVYGCCKTFIADCSMRIDQWNVAMACAAGWAAAESVLTSVPIASLNMTAMRTAIGPSGLGQVLAYTPPASSDEDGESGS